jgi:hypothetical protein
MTVDNEQIIRQAYKTAEDKDLGDGSRPSPTTARSPTNPSVSPTASLLARDPDGTPDGTLAEFAEKTPTS